MMQAVFTIESLKQLSVIAVPIRRDILFACQKEALSPNKYSKLANLSAQNVNYHFGKLYEAGFLYKKYEERKRGAFETFYMTIAFVIRVDQSIFCSNDSSYKDAFLDIDTESIQHANKLNGHFS
jgi:DNA-binding transcriptional ArsR family regulator